MKWRSSIFKQTSPAAIGRRVSRGKLATCPLYAHETAPTGAHPSLGDADGWSIFKGPPPAEAQGPAARVLGVRPWRYGRKPHSCHPRETHFSTLRLRSSGHPQRRYVSPDGGEAAATSPYERPHWFRTFRLGDWPPTRTFRVDRDPCIGLKRAPVVPLSPSPEGL